MSTTKCTLARILELIKANDLSRAQIFNELELSVSTIKITQLLNYLKTETKQIHICEWRRAAGRNTPYAIYRFGEDEDAPRLKSVKIKKTSAEKIEVLTSEKYYQELEAFFKRNYSRMVSYCAFCEYRINYCDIEEEVADVIFKEFEIHHAAGFSEAAIRRRINRRTMLNLRSTYTTKHFSARQQVEFIEDLCTNTSTPEEIVSAFQRLPDVPDLLINYSLNAGSFGHKKNSSTERRQYNYARKKFLDTFLEG